ncbi:DNA polymerase V [Enterobacter sp.]|uniref:DNA polymerase V n=1 Tax=Enterobacter sp. TaxID=42895 RepID=UPI002981292F|nr:DNA polymerase V [Enterobacter sp.]
MARRKDIVGAFFDSIVIEPSSRRIVRTADFVRRLEEHTHFFSLSEANAWIALYARTFEDCSTEEGERKTYFQYDPNGGI